MKKGKLNVTYAAKRIGILGGTYLCGNADRYSTIDYNSIVQYASKAAHVPESSITMAMEALYDALSYFVLNGHSVQIPNLGTFYLTVKCKSEDTVEDFVENFSQNLKSVNIRFLPCTDIKEAIANTSLNVEPGNLSGYVNDDVQQVTKIFIAMSGSFVEAENNITAPAQPQRGNSPPGNYPGRQPGSYPGRQPGSYPGRPAGSYPGRATSEQGSYKPKPGLNNSSAPRRGTVPNPNGNHLPRPVPTDK